MKFPRLFKPAEVSISKKESRAAHTLIMAPDQAVWSPRRFASFAKEGYQQNVVAFQCINRIADAVASVKWEVYRGDVQMSEHPLLKLLARPNPKQSGAEFMRELVSYFFIAGDSFTERVTVGGETRELYQLTPERMSIVPSNHGTPAAFIYTGPNGKKTRFDAADGDIWHMKTFNPLDDWYGQSPMEAGGYAIDQSNEAMAWMQSLMQNSARPSGALIMNSENTLDDESFHRLQAQIDEQYSGSKNAGRPMLLEGGLDWKQMGLSPTDMGIIEAKFSAARDVSLSFGVPPQLIGIPGDNTYANYAEARLSFWEDTVIPLIDLLKADFNHWLAEPAGVRLDHNLEEIPAIVEKRQTLWQMAEASNVMTINEKREVMGFDPVDGGDVLMVPPGLVPLGQEPEEPEEPEELVVDEKALRIIAGYDTP